MTTIESDVIDNTLKVIKVLKKKILKSNSQLIVDLPESQYRREHATIKISFPRRMGNTTLAIKCFKQFKNSILIAYNKLNMIELVGSYKCFRLNLNRIYAPSVDLTGSNLVSEVVVVDMVSFMSKRKLDSIYNIKAKLYILIG